MYLIVYSKNGEVKNTITTHSVGQWLIYKKQYDQDNDIVFLSAHTISDYEYEQLFRLNVQS